MLSPRLLVCCLPWIVACESGAVPKGKSNPPGGSGGHPVAAEPVAAEPAAVPAPKAPGGVEFPDAIEWHSWEEGRKLAKAQNKALMVVVYADWCSKCRALTPVFASDEVSTLAKRLVVVRQNHDENPAWLEPYNQKYGGYVPRIFFFDADGTVREDVTSGHPRYPYFYAAQQPEFLTRSMKRAIGS